MMNDRTRAMFRLRADIFKALAHPTRLFIVDQLSRQSRCVCELAEMVGADISTVSKHLSVLKSAGIAEDEKKGLSVYYTLKAPCVMNFFACLETLIKSSLENRLNLLEQGSATHELEK